MSGVPKVFGVLSIIFASIVMFGGLLGSCSMCATQMIDKAGPRGGGFGGMPGGDAMMHAMKTMYTGIGLQSLMLLGMSIWLLVIGIGQVRYRAWAQKQSVMWGLVALGCVGLMVLIAVAIIGPAYKEMFEAGMSAASSRHGGGPPPGMSGMGGGLGALMGGSMSFMTVLFYAPYPILMFLMFRRDSVKAAMTR